MNTRKWAAVGAAALLMGLAASAPAQAGLRFNGFTLNGLRMNGPDQSIVVSTPSGGGGFSFNAVKLYDVVLPDGAR